MPERRGTVLVLDDEEDNRDLMRLILEPRGYTMHLAATGREALRILAEHRVDVVLLDLLMPAMSGREFLEELERLPPDRRPAVLINSARRRPEIERETAGFDIFEIISKPFDISDVEGHIDRALQEGR